MLIVRTYGKLTPRQIGRFEFGLCAVALIWLAFVVRNDWSSVPVLFGLILFGIGQGSLVTLLFNVLVTASPKELAGDVGSLRGTTNNLAAAVGTAVAGALLVGLLSSAVMRQLAQNPTLPIEIQSKVNLDSITFVSNDQLESVINATSATPEQKPKHCGSIRSLACSPLKSAFSSWRVSLSYRSFRPADCQIIGPGKSGAIEAGGAALSGALTHAIQLEHFLF